MQNVEIINGTTIETITVPIQQHVDVQPHTSHDQMKTKIDFPTFLCPSRFLSTSTISILLCSFTCSY